MTLTQIKNLLYALICLMVAVTSETGWQNVVPDRWKHYIATAAFVALYLKSHWNYFVNPNGTPAMVAYDAKTGK